MPRAVREIAWSELTCGKLIGRGAMGSVYMGDYTPPGSSTSVAVAVKRLHASEAGALSVRDIERFRDELVLLASLQHANVVTCFGAVVDAPAHGSSPASPLAIVMEFVPETLKRRITATRGVAGSLPLRDAVSMALDLARGVEFLHGRSIVHRDLKPGNCLLTAHGALKLCDFGVSRQAGPGDSHMTRIGTPAFMAPEILRGEAYSSKCDVYSFGMILWQMVCIYIYIYVFV